MKQKFVNATMNDCRKGKEMSCQTTHCHPLRETPISEAPMKHHLLPVKVVPKKDEVSDLEKMKMEILFAMKAEEKKNRQVPKSKILSMSQAAPEPPKDYADVLAMLLKK